MFERPVTNFHISKGIHNGISCLLNSGMKDRVGVINHPCWNIKRSDGQDIHFLFNLFSNRPRKIIIEYFGCTVLGDFLKHKQYWSWTQVYQSRLLLSLHKFLRKNLCQHSDRKQVQFHLGTHLSKLYPLEQSYIKSYVPRYDIPTLFTKTDTSFYSIALNADR